MVLDITLIYILFGRINSSEISEVFVSVQLFPNKPKTSSSLVSGFEMDLIRVLEKMSSNKALKYLNLGQNTRQR